jgi:hypothetical protein
VRSFRHAVERSLPPGRSARHRRARVEQARQNRQRTENGMLKFATGILLLAAMAGTALAAEPPGETPPPKCEKAEVNPVTGHVLCLMPRGAPVEPPPAGAAAPCKPEHARGQWSWGPACAPEPGT